MRQACSSSFSSAARFFLVQCFCRRFILRSSCFRSPPGSRLCATGCAESTESSTAWVYGLLTALLGAVYAAVVLTIGQLYVGIDAKTPGWVVAGATLAVAAPFQPARRRIQRAVDRRVNRTRFDAARTAEAFTARLRDVIDLDTMSAEFLAVVDRTMQPTQASLWLRPTARARALHSELEADSWIIGSGGRGLGGLQRAATSVPPHAGARLYVEVDDLEQTLVKVEAFGVQSWGATTAGTRRCWTRPASPSDCGRRTPDLD